jgi:hypothetical protein
MQSAMSIQVRSGGLALAIAVVLLIPWRRERRPLRALRNSRIEVREGARAR